jgi:acetyl-CoA/propionyl-CoA carboxylase biotin carboxyl carrier protein
LIGPSPETIHKLGDKIQARKIAQSVNAPLVHGTEQPLQSAQEAVDFAKQYGLPIAIKAAWRWWTWFKSCLAIERSRRFI